MPVKVSRGPECIWGLTQDELLRAYKGWDNRWLFERFLKLKKDLKVKFNQHKAWREAAMLVPPPRIPTKEALDVLLDHDKLNNTERASAWAWEVKLTPPPEDASVRGDHYDLLRVEGLTDRADTWRPSSDAVVKGPTHAAEAPDMPIQRLLSVAKGREASVFDEVKWVASNLLIAWNDVDAKDVPSRAAVSMLSWAKDNTDQFFRDQFARTIQKSDMELEKRMRDSGRTISDVEVRWLGSVAKAAERTSDDEQGSE